jgi:hypothetical protein
MLLIYGGVPEDNTHIVAFWFSKCENKGIAKVTPHIFRLNVGKNDI